MRRADRRHDHMIAAWSVDRLGRKLRQPPAPSLPSGIQADVLKDIAVAIAGPLRDWLAAHGVSHVAMESTGVYCAIHLLERQGYRVTLESAA